MELTVPVLVSSTFVMDGNAQPTVGETVSYRTSFAEVAEDQDPDPELCRWWDVVATPVGEPHQSWPLGGEPRGPWLWSTAVQVPGWSATWSAPRRVEGAMRLRGQLWADYDVSTLDTTVTRRITRVRVVTQAVVPYPSGALGRLVVGSRAYHDVEASPLTFDDTGRGVPSWAPLKPIATGPAPGRAPAHGAGRAGRRPGRRPASLTGLAEDGLEVELVEVGGAPAQGSMRRLCKALAPRVVGGSGTE